MLDFRGVITTLHIFGIIIISLTGLLVVKYEMFNNYYKILSCLSIFSRQIKIYISQLIEKTAIYLNSRGYDIYIIKDNKQGVVEDSIIVNNLDKFKFIKSINILKVRVYCYWNAIKKGLYKELLDDRTGAIMGISYIMFVILVFIL